MIGLVMAGGRGSRMARSGGPAEKLLIRRGDGMPVVLGVVDALRSSGAVSEVHAATSPAAPAAAAALRRLGGIGIVPTPARGYSLDLARALSALAAGAARRRGEVLAVPGDMPLLRAADVRAVARAYARRVERDGRRPAWAAIVVPAGRGPAAAAAAAAASRPEYLAPGGAAAYTGVSIVDLRGAAARPGADAVPEALVEVDRPALRACYNTAADVGAAAAAATAARSLAGLGRPRDGL